MRRTPKPRPLSAPFVVMGRGHGTIWQGRFVAMISEPGPNPVMRRRVGVADLAGGAFPKNACERDGEPAVRLRAVPRCVPGKLTPPCV